MAGRRLEVQQKLAWNHTSQVLAMLYNANRGPKAKPLKPADFNPFAAAREAEHAASLPPEPISILKGTFVDQRPNR